MVFDWCQFNRKEAADLEQLLDYGLQRDMVFLVLFVVACGGLAWLVKWVLATSGQREERLIGITEKLAERFGIVADIRDGVGRLECRVNALIDKKGGV